MAFPSLSSVFGNKMATRLHSSFSDLKLPEVQLPGSGPRIREG
jgi:hypothetical protein